MNEKPINFSNLRLAYFGAIVATATVLLYSIMLLIYVIIRSSLTIYDIIQSEEKTLILFKNAISVAYSIAVFSIIMAIFSSMVGALTAIILKQSILHFNPKFLKRKTKIICVTLSILIVSIIYLLLRFLLKEWMTFDNIEPFLLWFLIPSVLFLIIGIFSGSQLNGLMKLQKVTK